MLSGSIAGDVKTVQRWFRWWIICLKISPGQPNVSEELETTCLNRLLFHANTEKLQSCASPSLRVHLGAPSH